MVEEASLTLALVARCFRRELEALKVLWLLALALENHRKVLLEILRVEMENQS